MPEVPATIPNPTPDFAAAQRALAAFLAGTAPASRVVALHDFDADGVAAGVVWQRAVERLGYQSVQRVLPDRERSAWTPENQGRVAATAPETLFVLDLGSQPVPVLIGVRTCFIDHHRPEGIPPGDTLISAYSWQAIPTTSLLVYELFSGLTGLTDLNWIAAIGALSDLGDQAPFQLVADAKKQYTAKYLKEATTLVNAVRRASAYNPEAAARALLTHATPRELVESSSPDVQALKTARAEVKVALEEAKKAAPVFAGQTALIRVHSGCQIHPLIAQIWRTRLPKYIVLAANDGYMPGRVNFSARAPETINLLDYFGALKLSDGEGNFGHGHDQASGGSLPVARWNELLSLLGFGAEVYSS